MSRRAKGFGPASHCDIQDSDVVIFDGDLTIRNADVPLRYEYTSHETVRGRQQGSSPVFRDKGVLQRCRHCRQDNAGQT